MYDIRVLIIDEKNQEIIKATNKDLVLILHINPD